MVKNLLYIVIVGICGYILYNSFALEPFDVNTLNIACIKNSRQTKSVKTTDKNLSNKIIITKLNFVYPVDKVQVQQKIRYGQSYFETEKGDNYLAYTIKQYDKSYAKDVFVLWLYRKEASSSYFFNKTTGSELTRPDKDKFMRRFLKMPQSTIDEIISNACK